MTEIDISRLGAIARTLKDTSHYHTSRFSDADITLVLKLIKSWPLEMIFPGEHASLRAVSLFFVI